MTIYTNIAGFDGGLCTQLTTGIAMIKLHAMVLVHLFTAIMYDQ